MNSFPTTESLCSKALLLTMAALLCASPVLGLFVDCAIRQCHGDAAKAAGMAATQVHTERHSGPGEVPRDAARELSEEGQAGKGSSHGHCDAATTASSEQKISSESVSSNQADSNQVRAHEQNREPASASFTAPCCSGWIGIGGSNQAIASKSSWRIAPTLIVVDAPSTRLTTVETKAGSWMPGTPVVSNHDHPRELVLLLKSALLL